MGGPNARLLLQRGQTGDTHVLIFLAASVCFRRRALVHVKLFALCVASAMSWLLLLMLFEEVGSTHPVMKSKGCVGSSGTLPSTCVSGSTARSAGWTLAVSGRLKSNFKMMTGDVSS